MKPHDDFAREPIPGLPERPPEGEKILWQGSPNWRVLARRLFHVRKIALYFATLAAWRFVSELYDGNGLVSATVGALWLLPVATAAVVLLAMIAWMTARTTMYTVTNRRVAMRIGIALDVTINIPFRVIDSAAVSHNRDGSGDMTLKLMNGNRIAYLLLWPHARPWHLKQPQPMLRALPNVETAAHVLSEALSAFVSADKAKAKPRPGNATIKAPQRAKEALRTTRKPAAAAS